MLALAVLKILGEKEIDSFEILGFGSKSLQLSEPTMATLYSRLALIP